MWAIFEPFLSSLRLKCFFVHHNETKKKLKQILKKYFKSSENLILETFKLKKYVGTECVPDLD